MKAARDVDAFLADRFGRYLFGGHYLIWCADPSLGGVAFWGTPDERDVAELTRIFLLEPRPGHDPPYDMVTDGRRLDRVSQMVFDPFARVAVRRLREQRAAKLLRRHAVIAPFGLVGTIMTGFFPMFGLPGGYRLFTDPEEAYGWLGRAEAHEEVERLIAAELGEAPAVTALRRWLADHLADADIEHAARALGRSARTFQRELNAARTSFRRELEHARIAAAQLRLAESDDKLEAIARAIGCDSASGLTRLFRRLVGEAPSEWRARIPRTGPR